MIIAIAADKNQMKTNVGPHFGRCNWFYIYNTEIREGVFIENEVRNMEEKAGCSAAELLIGKKINMVIAGRFGSKVADVFRKNNVQMVIPEIEQTITDIINYIK
jgi:predicted Fe-Mo cluster-binding NifX family protein